MANETPGEERFFCLPSSTSFVLRLSEGKLGGREEGFLMLVGFR